MQWIDRIMMIFITNNKVLIHVSLISVLHHEERLTMLDGELSDHRARQKNIAMAPDVVAGSKRHHCPANILGFFGGKKNHQVFSPAAADKT